MLLIYIVGCVPLKLIDNNLGYDAQTFLFTNIPGGSKIEMFGGCVLEKVVPVAPNIKGMGKSKDKKISNVTPSKNVILLLINQCSTVRYRDHN